MRKKRKNCTVVFQLIKNSFCVSRLREKSTRSNAESKEKEQKYRKEIKVEKCRYARYWQLRDSSYPFYSPGSNPRSRSSGPHYWPRQRSESSKVPRVSHDWAWVEVEWDAVELPAAVVCSWSLKDIRMTCFISRFHRTHEVGRFKNSESQRERKTENNRHTA